MLAACELRLVNTCCDCSGIEDSEAAELRRGRGIFDDDGHELS
jgi:hypothetical protein